MNKRANAVVGVANSSDPGGGFQSQKYRAYVSAVRDLAPSLLPMEATYEAPSRSLTY